MIRGTLLAGALAAALSPVAARAYLLGPDKRLTVQEARRILATIGSSVSPDDRRAVQAFIDQYGDRFDPGAAEVLARVAERNNVRRVVDAVRRASESGAIGGEEADGIVRNLVRTGATPAERRALLREVATAEQRGVRLSKEARERFESLRTRPGAYVSRPLNQKLPTRPGDDGNRVSHDGRGGVWWELKSGEVPLYDGTGFQRGLVRGREVRINFGQRKLLSGTTCVYVIAALLQPKEGGEWHAASGWIPESAVRDRSIERMPTIEAPRPPGDGEGGRFTLTGGTGPAARVLGKAATRLFGCREDEPAQACMERLDWKVLPRWPRGERASVGDYLLRRGGVANLCYNLPLNGGVSDDTFRVGQTFVAAAPSAQTRARVPLYRPLSARVVGTMEFLYGYVEWGPAASRERRYGWVAAWSLERQ